MDCKEVLNKVHRFHENRLTDIEVHNIKKHLVKCEECRKEYEEMKALFDILDNHQVVIPPPDFTSRVMEKINSYNKAKKISYRAKKMWGASFIAAGILITFLNISSFNYDVNDFAADIYKGSIELNTRVYRPFTDITNGIDAIKERIKEEEVKLSE